MIRFVITIEQKEHCIEVEYDTSAYNEDGHVISSAEQAEIAVATVIKNFMDNIIIKPS